MAVRRKATTAPFGGKDITPITISDGAASPTTSTYQAVIEDVSPVKSSEEVPLKDGDGAVNGLIFKNRTTALNIEFYVSEASIAASEAKQSAVISVGDFAIFEDTDIPEIDDATSTNKFVIKQVTKNIRFGDVRKIALTMMAYENDVSAEAV